ncbi:hypothetical protein [Streptomyces sp. NPDC095613]|uniref:hypothetical protein n=1 Tax=Streptomyces sp. NPDC095613 TaxID=3155540 RepID=UPI003322ADA8
MRSPDCTPYAPAAGQQPPSTTARDQANQLINAVNEAMETPTAYRDTQPLPIVGTSPPVTQPGRLPMSQRATDTSALMLSAGAASLPIGAAATGILWASGHANLAVIACICAAPPAVVLALSRLLKSTKETLEAAPPVHHHHYEGTVMQDHRSVNTQTRGLIANIRNQMPR